MDLLTPITFLPLLGAIALVFFPSAKVNAQRLWSLAVTTAVAALGIVLWFRFDAADPGLQLTIDRMWFSLASYNVGRGHVIDARRLAGDMDLDPDRWFDNVEKAMLLLSRPEHARRAQHGYCRGSEPVAYVREIRARYETYLDTLATR